MFCKQFRCNIIIDGNTFKRIFMCLKSRGVNILIYIVYGMSSLCYVLMLKIWVKIEQKILCS